MAISSRKRSETPPEAKNLVRILTWDSEFFGFPVARVIKNNVVKDELSSIFEYCSINKVKVLEFACDPCDQNSVRFAEAYGFQLADFRLIFEKILESKEDYCPIPTGFTFQVGKPEHVTGLTEITKDLFHDSRYHFDTKFPQDKIKALYALWVKKAVLGEFDDLVYILSEGEVIVGFSAVKFDGKDSGKISLLGVKSGDSNRGLGKLLMSCTLQAMAEKGIVSVNVITQGRNYSAQRLYQGSGFSTKKAELWYHCWFD